MMGGFFFVLVFLQLIKLSPVDVRCYEAEFRSLMA